MKHTPGPFDQIVSDLMAEYQEKKALTKFPGNPLTMGLHARAQGIKEVINHPLYAAAPELLEALELYQKYEGARDNEGLRMLSIARMKAKTAITKAKGEK